jgi:LPS O-antigen subunit length determinant protein (WzzB/FepE family)
MNQPDPYRTLWRKIWLILLVILCAALLAIFYLLYRVVSHRHTAPGGSPPAASST